MFFGIPDCRIIFVRKVGGLMPGGGVRMQKLVSLLEYKRLDISRLLTHRKGFGHIEEALMLMKDKPRDLIKPVVLM